MPKMLPVGRLGALPPVHPRLAPTGPLTDRQKEVLVAMLKHARSVETWANPSMTGNDIGSAIGFKTGQLRKGSTNHRGQVMGPAQRVIGTINGLKGRGLVTFGMRRDGLTGSAYRLTESGEKEAAKLMGEEEVYEMENVDELLPGQEPAFEVGDTITLGDEHEIAPGEEGEVLGVGRGMGMYNGAIVYDVLVEGTDEPMRVTEDEIAEAQ